MTAAARSPLIDGLKGLACALIVWHHLAFYGPMSDAALPLAPRLIAWLYDYGRMAVQVFLVLGGYLAAASLAPQGLARFGSARAQIAKRFVRLVVPYAVALVIAMLVAAAVRPWFDHASVPGAPSASQLVAHALLLHDVVGEEALSAGVWYVAIDFQLFVLTVLLCAGVRSLLAEHGERMAVWGTRALVVLGVALSLWCLNRDADWDFLAPYFFGAYGLGLLAFWAVRAERTATAWAWVAAMVVLGGVALLIDYRDRIAVAWVTALALVLLMRHPPRLPWTLRSSAARWSAPVLRLGQMSYSVFLVHFAVCLLVNAVVGTLWPGAPWLNALGMALAFVLSLVAGRQLYARVESRVPSWAMALRWQAGLVGTGLLVLMAANWS